MRPVSCGACTQAPTYPDALIIVGNETKTEPKAQSFRESLSMADLPGWGGFCAVFQASSFLQMATNQTQVWVSCWNLTLVISHHGELFPAKRIAASPSLPCGECTRSSQLPVK